jgi:hypothetical protein
MYKLFFSISFLHCQRRATEVASLDPAPNVSLMPRECLNFGKVKAPDTLVVTHLNTCPAAVADFAAVTPQHIPIINFA